MLSDNLSNVAYVNWDYCFNNLTFDRVYEYFNGSPALFVGIYPNGDRYLFYWMDYTEKFSEGYLCIQPTDEDLKLLEQKNISVRELYTKFNEFTYIYNGPEEALMWTEHNPPIDDTVYPPAGFYVEYIDVYKDNDDYYCCDENYYYDDDDSEWKVEYDEW